MSIKIQKSPGFTLIELSIVLVIISLIVGGVIGGKALLHSARIGKQVTQLHEYSVAYNNFILQYDAVPGDFREATSYWPSGGTANGDGDGVLEDGSNEINVSIADFDGEFPLFFQHLSLAELVPQRFDGSSVIGQGYPSMAFNAANGIIAGSSNSYEITSCAKVGAKLFMQVGYPAGMPDLEAADNINIFIPKDTKAIDRKLDDGIATTGKYCSWNGSGAATGTCHNNGVYNVAQQGVSCRSSHRL